MQKIFKYVLALGGGYQPMLFRGKNMKRGGERGRKGKKGKKEKKEKMESQRVNKCKTKEAFMQKGQDRRIKMMCC